jgi:hypothetical protein
MKRYSRILGLLLLAFVLSLISTNFAYAVPSGFYERGRDVNDRFNNTGHYFPKPRYAPRPPSMYNPPPSWSYFFRTGPNTGIIYHPRGHMYRQGNYHPGHFPNRR